MHKIQGITRKKIENKKQKVADMMMTLFDDEQILKAYKKDIKNDVVREIAIQMIRKGKLSLEEITEYVPSLSMDELRELKVEVLQLDN